MATGSLFATPTTTEHPDIASPGDPAGVSDVTVPPAPLARLSDPDTSHEAATEYAASGQHKVHLHYVLSAVTRYPGKTSRELALCIVKMFRVTNLQAYDAAHKRLPDLLSAGRVKKGPRIRCSVTGKFAYTWFSVKADSQPTQESQ
jgi:hypothetical protein